MCSSDLDVNVLLTHADRDHAGGMIHLIQDMDVPHSYASFEESGIDLSPIRAGQTWAVKDPYRIYVLHPPGRGSDNTHSVVILLAAPGLRILLMGDADMRAEQAILQQYAQLLTPTSDGGISSTRILKVGHHGSRSSTGQELLQTFGPQHALISAGLNNIHAHPHPEVTDRLAKARTQVHSTIGKGGIQLRWNGKHASFFRFKGGYWRAMDQAD